MTGSTSHDLSAADVVVALDVGGTSMKGALVTEDGAVLHSTRVRTGRGRGPQAVVDTVVDSVAALAATPGYTPRAVGLALPGVVDAAARVARYSSNIGWRDVPFGELIEQRLDLPTAIGHDIRAGGLAEARIGAGAGRDPLLFVAIGTGIAGAHVVSGSPLSGAHGAACELGHVVVRPDGPRCGCGQRGCVEAIASASSLARRYRQAAGADATAERITALAAAGDEIAADLWRETVEVLADGLLIGIAMLDPQLVVIGGGLGQAGETLLAPLRNAVRERASFHAVPEIVGAALGEEAGCIGAALMGLALWKEKESA